MKNISRSILVVFTGLMVSLFFQNCGEISTQNLGDTVGSSSGSFSASSALPNHREKEIIVKMKSAASDNAFRGWALGNGLELETEWPQINQSHWSWSKDLNVTDVQGLIAGTPFASEVDFTEPNYVYNQPKDEQLTLLEYSEAEVSSVLAAEGEHSQTSAPIGSTALWSLSNNQTPVVVAVIDTGVQVDHPAFVGAGAIWQNSGETPGNGIDDDGNGFVDDVNGWDFFSNDNTPDDQNGHGTHCAGIVLGVGQDIFSNTPQQAKIRIMGLKFLGPNGNGDTAGGISAIYYATDNGAQVISNSWGGGGKSLALEQALAYAYNRGVAVVSAAGNANNNNDISPVYPASYPVPNMLSVLASTDSDQKASFSNFAASSVNIAAPGVSILSTYPTSRYARLSGTSMATPFVAGTAALMKYQRPSLNGFEVKKIIRAQADTVPGLAGFVNDQIRLNSEVAVMAAENAFVNGSQPAFAVSRSIASSSSGDDGGGGGGCGMVGDIPPPSGPGLGLLLSLLFLPLLLSVRLRSQIAAQPMA